MAKTQFLYSSFWKINNFSRKGLSLCHKLKFSNSYIYKGIRKSTKNLLFQTINNYFGKIPLLSLSLEHLIFKQRNGVFSTNSNFLIHISFQPDKVWGLENVANVTNIIIQSF